jgi:hypothetical protein
MRGRSRARTWVGRSRRFQPRDSLAGTAPAWDPSACPASRAGRYGHAGGSEYFAARSRSLAACRLACSACACKPVRVRWWPGLSDLLEGIGHVLLSLCDHVGQVGRLTAKPFGLLPDFDRDAGCRCVPATLCSWADEALNQPCRTRGHRRAGRDRYVLPTGRVGLHGGADPRPVPQAPPQLPTCQLRQTRPATPHLADPAFSPLACTCQTCTDRLDQASRLASTIKT